MTLLADMLSTLYERTRAESGGNDGVGKKPSELALALLEDDGEASGFAIAGQLLNCYAQLKDKEKKAFFTFLAKDLDLDADALAAASTVYGETPTKDAYRVLMAAAEPPRQELVRRLNRAPGATARLVAMRADLRKFVKEDPSLGPVDLDFHHLFSSWFNRGFLVLRPINWESPASILEKIIEYEAVHQIESWDDLRRRLQPVDRRCFAFFHPAMPGEPLIFVEIALTKGVPGSIEALLAEERTPTPTHKADTAVFYSISNTQGGLAGVSFGNLLIKQVAEDLGRELPDLKSYVTLSPIPGLAKWAEAEGLAPRKRGAKKDDLPTLAADYLLNAKRGDGLPVDPVARFHLSNGARVHALHAEADPSERGRAQSYGAMVNYLYDLNKIAENAASFVTRGPVAATKQVRSLADAGAKARNKKVDANG